MSAMRRHRRLRRLFAVLVSLTLVLASVVGTHTHAREHGSGAEHGHIQKQLLPAGDLAGSTADLASTMTVRVDGDRHSAPDHSSCADFVCHGGIAILTNGGAALIRDQKHVQFTSVFQVIFRSSVFSLDRPPKANFLA